MAAAFKTLPLPSNATLVVMIYVVAFNYLQFTFSSSIVLFLYFVAE